MLPLNTREIELGAGDRVRTDDNHVGNVALYQLSYTRIKNYLSMVDRERIELSISGCKPDVFPLALTALKIGSSDKNRTCNSRLSADRYTI